MVSAPHESQPLNPSQRLEAMLDPALTLQAPPKGATAVAAFTAPNPALAAVKQESAPLKREGDASYWLGKVGRTALVVAGALAVVALFSNPVGWASLGFVLVALTILAVRRAVASPPESLGSDIARGLGCFCFPMVIALMFCGASGGGGYIATDALGSAASGLVRERPKPER